MDISTIDYVWHKYYSLNPAMLPPFLSLTLAKKILVVGKSINFLKACSKYSDRLTAATATATPGTTTSKLGNKSATSAAPGVDNFAIPTSVLTQHSIQTMSFGNESELEQSIYSIARVIESTLLNIVQHQFHLSVHLSALKKFLLLGQVLSPPPPCLAFPSLTLSSHWSPLG
jgi:gamma-tubulin complex component 3